MRTTLEKKKFLKILIIWIVAVLMLPMTAVVFFDPFFHYHKPIKPLKAVLTQAEYQVIGTLKTFDYDSLIAGSSMAENYNNHWFDEKFGVKAIKAVKPGANTSDLMYLINRAYEYKEIKNIYYTLDIAALNTTVREHYVNEGMPLYLYNDILLDDVKYLLNKHVLLKEIPYMIANSFLVEYDEGNSFNWAKDKQFGNFKYELTKEKKEDKKIEEYKENVEFNLNQLEQLIKTHPETNFIFMVPPYSSLWWYEAYMCGDLEYNFYTLQQAFERLIKFENVEIYYFQDIEEIVSDLSLYMDLLHYHPDINKQLVNSIGDKVYKVTEENKEKKIQNMRQLADKCINIYAKEYLENLQGEKNGLQ